MLKPMLSASYPNRHLDCELALETTIQQAIKQAVAAGWDRQEALLAIGHLAVNMFMADWLGRHPDTALTLEVPAPVFTSSPRGDRNDPVADVGPAV
jgi:hypothetical protein